MVHPSRPQPGSALAARGVHIISSRDISAPHLESRAFGLYHEQDGVISNLAMPVWGWGKLYEGIVRSILTGAWNDEGEHNADRAMNYYMGMSTDAIDLICSQRLPVRTRRLVDLLHERIRAGAFLPFVGRLPTRAAKSAWRPTWRSLRRKSSAWIIWRIISSAAFPRWTS